MADAKEKLTEGDVIARLRTRYSVDSGNGPQWSFLSHVRSAAGFESQRTMDALAMHLWRSRNFELHGHEVKVARSDWLRELKDAAKMEAWSHKVDRWWMVTTPDCIKDGELPDGWGHMVTYGTSLRVVTQAKLIPHSLEEKLISRDWLVCLLRAAGATGDGAEIRNARAEGHTAAMAQHQKTMLALRDERNAETLRANHEHEAMQRILDVLGFERWDQRTRDHDLLLQRLRVMVKAEHTLDDARTQLLRARNSIDSLIDQIPTEHS